MMDIPVNFGRKRTFGVHCQEDMLHSAIDIFIVEFVQAGTQIVEHGRPLRVFGLRPTSILVQKDFVVSLFIVLDMGRDLAQNGFRTDAP